MARPAAAMTRPVASRTSARVAPPATPVEWPAPEARESVGPARPSSASRPGQAVSNPRPARPENPTPPHASRATQIQSPGMRPPPPSESPVSTGRPTAAAGSGEARRSARPVARVATPRSAWMTRRRRSPPVANAPSAGREPGSWPARSGGPAYSASRDGLRSPPRGYDVSSNSSRASSSNARVLPTPPLCVAIAIIVPDIG